MYSLSVVDKLISVCNFDNHVIGQPAYVIRYPVLERTDVGSSLQLLFQSPANDASTYIIILFDLSILNTIQNMSHCFLSWCLVDIGQSFLQPFRVIALGHCRNEHTDEPHKLIPDVLSLLGN